MRRQRNSREGQARVSIVVGRDVVWIGLHLADLRRGVLERVVGTLQDDGGDGAREGTGCRWAAPPPRLPGGVGGRNAASAREAGSVREAADDPMERLTDQERRILVLLAEGKTNREIAEALFYSEKTVRNYVSRLLEKLELANRTEAAVFALRRCLVDAEDERLDESGAARRATNWDGSPPSDGSGGGAPADPPRSVTQVAVFSTIGTVD